MKKLLKHLLLILPLVLFFSYWPTIRLGSNESMNFELSLPLIWLVLFDLVGLITLIREHTLFAWIRHWRWLWLLFPMWLTLSVTWSLNPVRGLLTVGILWLLVFAGYAIWSVRDWLDREFRTKWWKWFFGSTLVACIWCITQCVLDLLGVSQEYSLMCDGCTYQMFGFPHPNGFAIEPQFMGNLLLAPTMAVIWLLLSGDWQNVLRRQKVRSSHHESQTVIHSSKNLLLATLTFVYVAALFLTFSRGAIYAFGVGLLFMLGFEIFRTKAKARNKTLKQAGVICGIVLFSFAVALNLQGLMTELGPTSDSYADGVAKVLNHLSLGIIDIKGTNQPTQEDETIEGEPANDEYILVENPVENSKKEEPIFSGYVAESTDTRVRLSGAAVTVWSENTTNTTIGVGLGGAGYALYNHGLSPAPKEIIQNEYASLLLETGLIGVSLFILTILLVIRVILKSLGRGMLLSLLLAYGVSLVFFAGLPNALHIMLLPAAILSIIPSLAVSHQTKRHRLS